MTTKKSETKIVRIYDDEYKLLEKVIDKLKKMWGRNATFADAVKHVVKK